MKILMNIFRREIFIGEVVCGYNPQFSVCNAEIPEFQHEKCANIINERLNILENKIDKLTENILKNSDDNTFERTTRMDRAGIEPAASTMPR